MISKLHEMLQKKQISCLELTKAYVDSAKKLNDKFNAYVLITEQLAFDSAKKVD